MQYQPLGATGIRVSRLAFGAGPVAEVMVGDDYLKQQALLRRTVDVGINWIDTAAGYGDGRSEENLGAALEALGVTNEVHLATKVRLMPNQLQDIPASVRASVAASRNRLERRQITLLQFHNSITSQRGQEPTSVTPADVLEPGGVLEALQDLREEGVVRYLGITAIGQPGPLREVVGSAQFDTIQVPYNMLNPSAGQLVPDDFPEANYGNIIRHAAGLNMGVFAIRVFAGGAVAGNPPSRHTLRTKFFPQDLYQRDQQRAVELQSRLPREMDLKQAAVRYVLSHPNVSSAIIGFSNPRHIDEAESYLQAGPLPNDLLTRLELGL